MKITHVFPDGTRTPDINGLRVPYTAQTAAARTDRQPSRLARKIPLKPYIEDGSRSETSNKNSSGRIMPAKGTVIMPIRNTPR